MNKSELIQKVAKKTNKPKTEVALLLDMFLATIKDSLADNEPVTLIGFGTFHTVPRAAREGRNPRTGEVIKIPATVLPRFKAGKALRNAANRSASTN